MQNHFYVFYFSIITRFNVYIVECLFLFFRNICMQSESLYVMVLNAN